MVRFSNHVRKGHKAIQSHFPVVDMAVNRV